MTRYARLINTAIADIPDDMTVTLHLCRGNFKSTYMGAGSYETVEDVLFKRSTCVGFHGVRRRALRRVRAAAALPKGKRVALGLVTTKSGRSRARTTQRRIDAAAQHADLERLCLTAQCGFASTEEGNLLTEDEQWAKLELHRRGRRASLGLSRWLTCATARATS